MEIKDSTIPTKVEERYSFLYLIRKILKKTSKTIDKKGKVKYISYPLKKGFTDKQKRELEELEINDVPIVGETRDMSLESLVNLKKLILGRGVVAISEKTIPNFNLETLELSDTVKQIPPNVIMASTIKKVKGKDFCIASRMGETRTDIYIDTDERLHYIENGHLSSNQLDYIESHGENIDSSISTISNTIITNLLEESSNFENKDTLYIFNENKLGTRNYSVHAVIDEYPMPQNRTKTFSDDKLVGILVNGKEEIDLEILSRYPNLQKIYIGKDVKRLVGTETLKETDIINKNKVKEKVQQSNTGKLQEVYILSEDTVLLNSFKKADSKQDIQKVTEKEISLED